MVKPNLAGKLKNLGRELKEENSQGGVKKAGDKLKQGTAQKKDTDGGKASGRKA